MTPADHGYAQCGWCGVWRAPGMLDADGSCIDHDACARAMSVNPLKAPAIRAAWVPAAPRANATCDGVTSSWVPTALDWHTVACLTRQATGEGCNCRPWTEAP